MPRGGQLQISTLQPSHQGRYTCLAQDRGTEMRKDFLVLVRGEASWGGGGPWALPPRGAFLLLFFLSSSASLFSFSHSGTPHPWCRGPQRAQRAGGRRGEAGVPGRGAAAPPNLLAEGRAAPAAAAPITCPVSQWGATAGLAAHPKSCSLGCNQARGISAPWVPWGCSGDCGAVPCRMSPDGSALLLEALHAADSGAYTCLARNGAGEDAQLHVLSVLGEWGWGHRARPPVPSSPISPSCPLTQCPPSLREVPMALMWSGASCPRRSPCGAGHGGPLPCA